LANAAAAAAGHTTVPARAALQRGCVGRHLANRNEMRVSGSTTATQCCSYITNHLTDGTVYSLMPLLTFITQQLQSKRKLRMDRRIYNAFS